MQDSLFESNAGYRMWKYAVLVADTDGAVYVKDGDTRADTLEDALDYAASQTIGKARALLREDDILGVWDMTEHAISIGKDPSDVDASRGYDNEVRDQMPLRGKVIKNFRGQRSLELHPIPAKYITDHGDDWRTVLSTEWDDAHKRIQNGGSDVAKATYIARPYLDEAFNKISTGASKFLLAACTGAGKETSSLASLIFIHDVMDYSASKISVCVATIPSTTSEIFNELGSVAGMQTTDYGFIDFDRIDPYITKQWYDGYFKNCSARAKLYIRERATIINQISDLPKKFKSGSVPVLFGSFHDLALKAGDQTQRRYQGLEKRIGTLLIGEAHQMLSNADNKMWRNLNSAFGKKCFKFFVTGTPYDFIYGSAAAEYFSNPERALFTRDDLYTDKRTNPDTHYSAYPDFNYYGIQIAEIVGQLKEDPNWKDDAEAFTFGKLFTIDRTTETFLYEKAVLWIFQRMFGETAFSDRGDPLSIYNAPGLCELAKQHIFIALPTGSKEFPAQKVIVMLKELLINHGIFNGQIFDAYEDDLGDRKEDIKNAQGRTMTLTCIKDCTGANIPQLGTFVFMRNIGDSVKFFEQCTGRVGRAFAGKTNCGVFLADLENNMNILISIQEKISLERGENFSTNYIITQMIDNYNFFIGRNGAWVEIDPIDFSELLENLNARAKHGLNLCIRHTPVGDGFDLSFNAVGDTESEKLEINSNDTAGKNAIKEMAEQMGLWENNDLQRSWLNMKKKFVTRCAELAYTHDIQTVQEARSLVIQALADDDREVLGIVGQGVEWFPSICTPEHIDIAYTNRWINRMHQRVDSTEEFWEFFGDEHFTQKNSNFVSYNTDAILEAVIDA